MNDGETLGTLMQFRGYRLVTRALCCPECGSDVELLGGEYRCTRSDGGVCLTQGFATLSELAVRG